MKKSTNRTAPTTTVSAPEAARALPSTETFDIPQVRSLLHEVCFLASTANSVMRHHPEVSYDEDELQDRIQILRQSLDRVGWVADVALRHLGDAGAMPRAEDWMLPGA